MRFVTHITIIYREILMQPVDEHNRLASREPETMSKNALSSVSLSQATCFPASEDDESGQFYRESH